MDIEFLESTGFPYIETLKEFGWWNFLTIHRSIYENLVRAFYSNANNTYHKHQLDKKFKTNIGDTNFKITTLVIHNKFGIHLDGEDYASWTQDYVKASQEVTRDDTLTTRISNTNLMDLNTRLLHLICCQMIYPRNGSFSFVTRIDLWLLQCIKAKRRLHLCLLMIESFTGKNRFCPMVWLLMNY